MALILDVKIRDSNYDEMAHINKKPLREAIKGINYALQKEGLNQKIILIENNQEEPYPVGVLL